MNYRDLQETEFISFFGIHEAEKTENANRLTRVVLKTGGFQEFIHLELKIDRSNEIKQAVLEIDRSWIGNELSLNPFAKDICKSYIDVICRSESNPIINDMIIGLFEITGKNDNVLYVHPPKPINEHLPETRAAVKVFIGLEPSMDLTLDQLKLSMTNMNIANKDILRVLVDFSS